MRRMSQTLIHPNIFGQSSDGFSLVRKEDRTVNVYPSTRRRRISNSLEPPPQNFLFFSHHEGMQKGSFFICYFQRGNARRECQQNKKDITEKGFCGGEFSSTLYHIFSPSLPHIFHKCELVYIRDPLEENKNPLSHAQVRICGYMEYKGRFLRMCVRLDEIFHGSKHPSSHLPISLAFEASCRSEYVSECAPKETLHIR